MARVAKTFAVDCMTTRRYKIVDNRRHDVTTDKDELLDEAPVLPTSHHRGGPAHGHPCSSILRGVYVFPEECTQSASPETCVGVPASRRRWTESFFKSGYKNAAEPQNNGNVPNLSIDLQDTRICAFSERIPSVVTSHSAPQEGQTMLSWTVQI